MRIKLPLFDNPTIKRLHPMSAEGPHGMVEGIQLLYSYPNGFGASVVQHVIHVSSPTYMPGKFTWELAVLSILPNGLDDIDKLTFDLCYTTEITEDVVKPLRPTDVEEYLRMIAMLPQKLYEETEE